MALRFLLDENLPGRFRLAISRHNAIGIDPIDVVRVGEPDDLPFGSKDPAILQWAEQEQRVLVTKDRNTMPKHLADHLATGRHSPGVFLIRKSTKVREVLEFLVLAAHESDSTEWQDQIEFIP